MMDTAADMTNVAGEPDPLEAPPPAFTTPHAERIVADAFGVNGAGSPLVSERDQNVKITTEDGRGFVLKIGNPADDPGVIDMQTQALLHVARTDPTLPVMRLVPTVNGEFQVDVTGPDGRFHIVRLVTLLPGRIMEPDELRFDTLYPFGVACARLGRALRGFFHASAGHPLLWNVKHALKLRPLVQHIPDAARRGVVDEVLDRFEEHVQPVFGDLRAQVIHNDLTPDNCLFDPEQRVSGIVDFGDMAHSALICDFVSTVEPLMGERSDHFESLEATAAGYASVTPFLDDEIALLPDLLLARWATTAVISAWRVRSYPENAEYITGWDAGVWAMLDTYRDMGLTEYQKKIREAMIAATRADRAVPRAGGSFDEMVQRRGRLLGSAISPLSYDRPLHLVRGRGAWLYDAEGRAYLDCYNNVPVVGHSHPRVVDAIARQAATLNTNARYLHGAALDLAERLIATMPDGLDTVMLVNSGSEANDLAWRLATTATGGTGGLVTDFAYHGVTTVVADLSPEEWRSGSAAPNIATVPAPDGYRGRHRREEPGWTTRYAEHVDEAVAALAGRGVRPAAMVVDSGFTSDGILTPPATYLQDAVRRWREAGGLFVADEVQTGFGRPGSHLWGFDVHGVVPDVVTLGKPMGNGHPVAAVVTRADIVDRFAQETEWFSTFGGNPVACEASLAVLDVIEQEGVQRNAAEQGAWIRGALEELMARHELIGDVRSLGLLIGVELVRDRRTREPATTETDVVLNAMREHGVLVGTTGRQGNVLKIRPPLVITREEAEVLVGTLDRVFEEGLASG
ncbi:MAG: aminotransferase class III-fold pyridoxal phosphate-dependent enzyme [Actinomycetota bacterium]